MDIPTLKFTIAGVKVCETTEGDVWTGKVNWTGETDQTIHEAFQAAADITGDKTATSEAGDWLMDYLVAAGGIAESSIIKKDGKEVGHSVDALKRARTKLKVATISQGFPRRTYWSLPPTSVAPTTPTALTTPTAPTAPTVVHSAQSAQSVQLEAHGDLALTGDIDVRYRGHHPSWRSICVSASLSTPLGSRGARLLPPP